MARSYVARGLIEGSNIFIYTKDHLGSTREVVANDGVTVESRYDYDPWGKTTKIGGIGAESDFLYTGHFHHARSGLYLAQYRAYDSELGRWLSRDPLGFVDGPNLYAYVRNSPVNLLDASGLFGVYAHTSGTAGHTRAFTKDSKGGYHTWDYGRYDGKDKSSPYEGDNILKHTASGPYGGDNVGKKLRSVEFLASPGLEKIVHDCFQNLFDKGSSKDSEGNTLPKNMRYMDSKWNPYNDNCTQATFDNGLEKALGSVPKESPLYKEAQYWLERVKALDGPTPGDIYKNIGVVDDGSPYTYP